MTGNGCFESKWPSELMPGLYVIQIQIQAVCCVWLVGLCTKSGLYYISQPHQSYAIELKSNQKTIWPHQKFWQKSVLCCRVFSTVLQSEGILGNVSHLKESRGVSGLQLGQIVHQRAVWCTYTSKLQCMLLHIYLYLSPLSQIYIHMYLGAMHRLWKLEK